MSSSLKPELDSSVWMAQGEALVVLNGAYTVWDFEEFPIGVFLRYLKVCILNKNLQMWKFEVLW